jgi:hypothetical protein
MRADQLPPQLQGRVPTKSVFQGDVVLEPRSPFEILPDPMAESLEEAEWIIEEVIQSEDWVQNHYGVNLTGDTEVSPQDPPTLAISHRGKWEHLPPTKVLKYESCGSNHAHLMRMASMSSGPKTKSS